VLNLARNAVQAAAELAPPGDVTLSATPADGAVVLAVANRGPAIPAEALPRLFEPFFTTRQKGTGLGLAFVHEIVTDHRGAVEVACEGGVTTFRVTLPAGEPPGG
jgi:signal transduction histidine kinase